MTRFLLISPLSFFLSLENNTPAKPMEDEEEEEEEEEDMQVCEEIAVVDMSSHGIQDHADVGSATSSTAAIDLGRHHILTDYFSDTSVVPDQGEEENANIPAIFPESEKLAWDALAESGDTVELERRMMAFITLNRKVACRRCKKRRVAHSIFRSTYFPNGCPIQGCGHKVGYIHNYKEHCKDVHWKNIKYHCNTNECPEYFTTGSKLYNHLKNVHKIRGGPKGRFSTPKDKNK